MKGVIFNVLEEFIVENWGEETFEEILSACPVHMHEGFIAPGTYADSDLATIVQKSCERLGVPAPQALRAFGRFLLPRLVARYPSAVRGIDGPEALLRAVDDAIHVEVRKLVREAETPRVHCEDEPGSDALRVSYRSSRRLCDVFAGLLAGVGDHYGSSVEMVELACMRAGADCCEFRVRFPRERTAPGVAVAAAVGGAA